MVNNRLTAWRVRGGEAAGTSQEKIQPIHKLIAPSKSRACKLTYQLPSCAGENRAEDRIRRDFDEAPPTIIFNCVALLGLSVQYSLC